MCYEPYTETEEYKGYTIKIIVDTDAPNPRLEFDNLGIMTCRTDTRYDLGDPQMNTRFVDLEETVKAKDVFALGLYFHDHGMIGMSCDHDFTHEYDPGLIGYIWVTKETVRNEYSCKRITRKKRQTVLECLRGEVTEYSQYLSGDVWGYHIVGPRSKYDPEECDTCEGRDMCPECDGCDDGENLDGCWGFFGQEYCLAEAKSMVDYYVEQAEKEKQAEIAPWMEIIPLHGGTPC